MARKQTAGSRRRPEPSLPPDEAAELQIILDRLSVQSPEGESFSSWLQSLKRSLEGRERLVAVLLESLSRQPTEAGFRAFAELKDLVSGKSCVKTVKQAGYRFSQKGYSPEMEGGEAEPVVLVAPEARMSQAHMAVGPMGYLFLTALISPSPTSDPVCVSAYFERRLTQLSVKSSSTTTRLYRDLIQRMNGLFRFPLCEIPVWHAALLLREMGQWAGGLAVTADARQASQHLGSYEEPGRPAYVHELMEAIENPEAEMRDLDLEPLLEVIPLSYLILGREELSPLAQRLRELESSVLVIPHEMKMDRMDALVDSAIEELCSGERRERVRRIFEELALWLRLSRQGDLARDAWVVAQHLESSASWWKNRMLGQLVYMSLTQHWPDDFGPREAPEESSRPYHETESGLILLK